MKRFAVVIALAAAACRQASAPPPPIVLISIDTTRSDHVGCYGYRAGTTPNIDALARDGVVYEHAYSHCPLTLPSHATMLTGLLPQHTGVRDNVGFRLREDVPTIAEALSRAGYATHAAVSAYVLRRQTGIARGFDDYDDRLDAASANATIGRLQRAGAETIAAARRMLQIDRPFFLFVHLYEPHTPYEPPAQYARFTPYDGEIACADDLAGTIIGDLKKRGLYDRALIIVTSDHGEALGEHGEDEHGLFLYRATIQVPLIVKFPGSTNAGLRIESPVQISDIAATMLVSAGLDASRLDGAPLPRHEARRERLVYSETWYPRFHFGWSDLQSLVGERYHAIAAPKPELYDVREDARETINVIAGERRTAQRYLSLLSSLRVDAAAPEAGSEERARLAALGYIGSAAQSDRNASLADPKDKLGTFRSIRESFAAYKERRYTDALRSLEPLLAENRRMIDLWDLKARTLVALGDNIGAIAAAREGLRAWPQAHYLAIYLGGLLLNQGDLEGAAQHAELAMSTDPAAAHEILARVAIVRGDVDAADREARLALAADADRPATHVLLGRVAAARHDYDRAFLEYDRAEELVRREGGAAISEVGSLRGDALARLGRSQEAESAFLNEIAAFPQEPDAYQHLILLYAAENRGDLVHQTIGRLAHNVRGARGDRAIADSLRIIGVTRQ